MPIILSKIYLTTISIITVHPPTIPFYLGLLWCLYPYAIIDVSILVIIVPSQNFLHYTSITAVTSIVSVPPPLPPSLWHVTPLSPFNHTSISVTLPCIHTLSNFTTTISPEIKPWIFHCEVPCWYLHWPTPPLMPPYPRHFPNIHTWFISATTLFPVLPLLTFHAKTLSQFTRTYTDL